MINYAIPAAIAVISPTESRGALSGFYVLNMSTISQFTSINVTMASNLGNIVTNIIPRPTGKIAWVKISRTAKLNSLNTHLLTRLPTALDAVQRENKDLLAVVLTGEGNKSFIGGADIFEMGGLKTAPDAKQFITRVHQVCSSIRTCSVPVIARMNGYTLGAGLEIAASCDLRVASWNAVFGMPEVRRVSLPRRK